MLSVKSREEDSKGMRWAAKPIRRQAVSLSLQRGNENSWQGGQVIDDKMY
jgi:hypothetical protein